MQKPTAPTVVGCHGLMAEQEVDCAAEVASRLVDRQLHHQPTGFERVAGDRPAIEVRRERDEPLAGEPVRDVLMCVVRPHHSCITTSPGPWPDGGSAR